MLGYWAAIFSAHKALVFRRYPGFIDFGSLNTRYSNPTAQGRHLVQQLHREAIRNTTPCLHPRYFIYLQRFQISSAGKCKTFHITVPCCVLPTPRSPRLLQAVYVSIGLTGSWKGVQGRRAEKTRDPIASQ